MKYSREQVALKIWLRAPGQSRSRAREERFRQSVRLSTLRHPNIVTSHEYGEFGNRDFTVMEYIEGRRLDSRIDSGGLPLAQVVDYGVQLCRGLEAAHSLGVLHNDLKSKSILIDHRECIKVVDFGASLCECEMPGTLPSELNDSANYLAPKKKSWVGKPSGPWKAPVIDQRADVFSLGVLLYEMLAGRRPFDRGHSSATAHAVVEEEPLSLRSIRPHLPSVVFDLVDWALRKDPGSRCSTVSEIGSALARVL